MKSVKPFDNGLGVLIHCCALRHGLTSGQSNYGTVSLCNLGITCQHCALRKIGASWHCNFNVTCSNSARQIIELFLVIGNIGIIGKNHSVSLAALQGSGGISIIKKRAIYGCSYFPTLYERLSP
ncbi:hypothetical protein D3C75_658490 [compost metagenome]